jgi:hypothetical protein
MGLLQKLHKIRCDLEPIAKNKSMSNNTKYRSASDVFTEVCALLELHKVLVFPSEIRNYTIINDSQSKNGQMSERVHFEQVFLVCDVDTNEERTFVIPSEGKDPLCSGKATTIAQTFALKSLFERLFMIVERDSEKFQTQLTSEIVTSELTLPEFPNQKQISQNIATEQDYIEKIDMNQSSNEEPFLMKSDENRLFFRNLLLECASKDFNLNLVDDLITAREISKEIMSKKPNFGNLKEEIKISIGSYLHHKKGV